MIHTHLCPYCSARITAACAYTDCTGDADNEFFCEPCYRVFAESQARSLPELLDVMAGKKRT